MDVAVDQVRCVETTHPTTQDAPVFEVDGVLQYCVANMPGAYPETSTLALTNVTLPYTLKIANKGYRQALGEDKALARGLNLLEGKVTCEGIAKAHSLPYHPLEEVLG